MNFKQFNTSDNQWHDIPYYQHKTATDTLTLPATLYPNDTSITVGIKGNTTQSGTPSPDNPVIPQGTGDRTAQLFDKNTVVVGERILANSVTSDSGYAHTDYIECEGYSYITVNKAHSANTTNIYFYADKTNTPISYYKGQTAEVPANAKYVRINMDTTDINTFMVNSGETALPYEPYGIKIPISCGGTTTPVYLGEVQTVRQIKKVVFTGTERIEASSSNHNYYIIYFDEYPIGRTELISTHFATANYVGNIAQGEVRFADDNRLVVNYDDGSGGVSNFISWLQQQYANGTPVCVWYVLATPTTATVNEPLMKIGNYADSLNTSVPCTAGENTLDVQTTVQPSEVTAGFSGWHPVRSVHERENGQWD